MKSLLLALTVAAAPLASVSAMAGEAHPDFALIHVNDLAQMLATTPDHVQVFDANDSDFRQTNGVIPQAALLTSASSYDVKATLPADHSEKLVFYCANPKCMASHAAAKRAVQAGYQDVAVLSDGLLGWKGAGQPVKKM